MKKRVWIRQCIILAVFIAVIIFVCTKDYWVSTKDSFTPYVGAIDIYNATREELIEFDKSNYAGVFGEVKNAKEAVQIAAEIVREEYGNDEYPYIVKFNKNANAWIVKGSLPIFRVGGVASVAIDKNTGEILMMIHTK